MLGNIQPPCWNPTKYVCNGGRWNKCRRLLHFDQKSAKSLLSMKIFCLLPSVITVLQEQSLPSQWPPLSKLAYTASHCIVTKLPPPHCIQTTEVTILTLWASPLCTHWSQAYRNKYSCVRHRKDKYARMQRQTHIHAKTNTLMVSQVVLDILLQFARWWNVFMIGPDLVLLVSSRI